MRILFAPDSFKGSLTAPAVAAAMARGFVRVFPDCQPVLVPVADGGEGTVEAMVVATNGILQTARVTGPLGHLLDARWGLLGDGQTAVVELAEAAGLTRLSGGRRDPEATTTRGVGELIRIAAQHPGVRRLVVGLGGSATNDGGAGILQALGWRLLDASGGEIGAGGGALGRVRTIIPPKQGVIPRDVDLTIAVDVSNPLVGPDGASAVFGPQKGADPATVERLDRALATFRDCVGLGDFAGAGAAGGAAYGLRVAFPDALLRPGIDLVLETVGFDTALGGAVLVVTGEGRLDRQTLSGKVVAGVARRCAASGVPVVALAGGVDPSVGADEWKQLGLAAVLPVVPGPCTLSDSVERADVWVADAAERAARWLAVGSGFRLP